MTKIIILGCGSSLGSPWITNYWGKCDKKNSRNIRTRCSAFIQKNDLSILIDTSPDIKKQILDNKIKEIDYVLYTHEHSDQTNGIFELKPFVWKKKERINIYADKSTLKSLIKKYDYCFFEKKGYGPIKSTAYVFDKIAYISDCNGIEKRDFKKLLNLQYLIIDCLRIKNHPTHFNLEQAIQLNNMINPKNTILTNLHTDLDYNFLKRNLPKNIIPAYDGMVLKT